MRHDHRQHRVGFNDDVMLLNTPELDDCDFTMAAWAAYCAEFDVDEEEQF